MGRSTWSGPIFAGNIFNTTGTTLGQDVKNTGSVVLSQEVLITQAGSSAALATNIVLPAGSLITSIRLYVSAPWDGVAATLNLGTTNAANQLAVAADNSAGAIGIVNIIPGASAPRVALWGDVGNTDVRIWVLSTNTGTGTGRLSVQYVQLSAAS